MNKKNYTGLNVGSSSILVVFILLCLVTFSILSMVSANADYRLSRKVADRTDAYYKASNEAQEIFAAIDAVLQNHYSSGISDEDFLAALTEDLTDYDTLAITSAQGQIDLDYTIPFTETQSLHVALNVPYPSTQEQNAVCRIVAWQVESSSDWEPDNHMKLFDPEAE